MATDHSNVTPLDPAFNARVDALFEDIVDICDSEEMARRLASGLLFASQRLDRERAISGVPESAYDMSSPSMRETLAWVSAASPELNAEFRAFIDATAKAEGSMKGVEAWMRENDPRSVQ